MYILTIRTDQPTATIGLIKDYKTITSNQWQAHRQLAETIHTNIQSMLDTENIDWHNIDAVLCYQGPGSFTGLRIGISVANALASSLQIPIVASTGDDWLASGMNDIKNGITKSYVVPNYGQEAHITTQRK